MKKQRSLDTELMDMIDNLYLLGRRMRMMENKPRSEERRVGKECL